MRRLISSCTKLANNDFDRVTDHAESLPTSKKQVMPQKRPNLSVTFIGRRVIMSAFAAMACQAKRTHWEQKN